MHHNEGMINSTNIPTARTALPASAWGADTVRICARQDEARWAADPRLDAEELAAAFARALEVK